MQVFISHSPSDRAIAAHLTDQLEAAGVSAWNAENRVLPGDDLYKVMSEALESSELMVVLYSKGTKESANVQHEIQYALTSGGYRGRVVPVLVDMKTFEAGTEVPWLLLRLDPIYVHGVSPDFDPVVRRVQSLAKAGV